MAKILIVDDDRAVSDLLARYISEQGHTVSMAHKLADGLEAIEEAGFDVVFLDVKLPDGDGLESLPKFKQSSNRPEVIIITGAADANGARLAIKNGAWDYIAKPCTVSEVALPLYRALAYRKEKNTVRKPVALKRCGILGNSPLILSCLDQIAEVSASEVNVLLTGETGTGKELFARAIHRNSGRAQRGFVVVDCTVLPESLTESMLFGHVKGAFTGADANREGLIKQADGGTLFLDEIGELPLSLQKSLLRVLQEHIFRPVGSNKEVVSNFRLLAATNRNLEDMVQAGNFRQDLLYRLKSCALELPPLRSRTEDIKELAMHYAAQFCDMHGLDTKGFAPDFFEVLCQYDWPGNVRELVNAIGAAVIASRHESTLYPKHLSQEIRLYKTMAALRQKALTEEMLEPGKPMPTFKEYRKVVIGRAEKDYLTRLMADSRGSIDLAQRISGLGRSRIYGLLKEHGFTGV